MDSSQGRSWQSLEEFMLQEVPTDAEGAVKSSRTRDCLPLAWWRQLVLSLPAHARLKLRQCSRQLQQVVDDTGLHLTLSRSRNAPAALHLCHQNLASLDISEAPVVPQLSAGLPGLLKLTCTIDQIEQLLNIAGCSPRLAKLKLGCRMFGWCSTHYVEFCENEANRKMLLQLPGRMTSLRSLEMTKTCHKLFAGGYCAAAGAQQPLMWALVGSLTTLNSLVLQTEQRLRSSASRWLLSEQCWQAAVLPLVGLTRLEICTRFHSSSSSDAVGGEGHGSASSNDSDKSGVPPVASTAADAVAAAADQALLQQLRHLRCCGVDKDGEELWNLTWLAACTSLTSLDLAFCCAYEVDFEVIGQLRHLCSLSVHYMPDEAVSSSQLAPLAACKQLTCLRLDSLVVEAGHGPSSSSAAATTAAAAATAVTGSGHTALQHVLSVPGATGAPAGSAAAAGTDARLPQLCSLQKLVAGVLASAPVSTLAPNLTQLRDLDYDLAELDLPGNFLNEHPPPGREALAALDQLQLLAVNITGLVRHAAYASLTSLSCLRELHIDMVGNLSNTHLSKSGLPHLPHLTRLVMTLAATANRDLVKTYTTEEDVLLWQNQSTLRCMRLRGSKLLGGFLVHDEYLAQLPAKLPLLHCIELVKCADLEVSHLCKLAASGAVKQIVVLGCENITARQCYEVQQECGGSVDVENFSSREGACYSRAQGL